MNLVRTSTMAAYVDGVEHYVTGFEFAGGGAKFGSIVPLPGVPTKVVKGGKWTLQRLQIETQPQPIAFAAADLESAAKERSARVLFETTIDALDITILSGGGDEVGQWAKDNGFRLPPDAPEVLDFYAERSPVFMAARFDVKRANARDQGIGDSTVVHLSIPTDNPWVPLRILGLGKQAKERIDADLYLLTPERPSLLPRPAFASTLATKYSRPASGFLLSDLRSDRGMKWLPENDMWLTYIRINGLAGELTHDLDIDARGSGLVSDVDAGLFSNAGDQITQVLQENRSVWPWMLATLLAAALVLSANKVAGSRR